MELTEQQVIAQIEADGRLGQPRSLSEMIQDDLLKRRFSPLLRDSPNGDTRYFVIEAPPGSTNPKQIVFVTNTEIDIQHDENQVHYIPVYNQRNITGNTYPRIVASPHLRFRQITSPEKYTRPGGNSLVRGGFRRKKTKRHRAYRRRRMTRS